MKKVILSLSLVVASFSVMAQKSTTTSAVITFDATTAKDALPKAENKTVIGSLDKTTGALLFEAAVNNFAFSNPMMQDHFNGAQWMNSTAFPKFTFSGKIDSMKKIKFGQNGTYKVNVSGNLTIKGISKPVSVPATFIVKDGIISTSSSFDVKLKDYGITGQPIESGKVAEKANVKVSASFQ